MPSIGRDILPSHVGIEETAPFYDGGLFDNIRLRFGEVQEIIYPDQTKSLSKKFIEYTVYVQHRDNGIGVGKMYNHCILANPLAGLADEFEFTLRVDDQPSASQKSKNSLGLGSKVLILCLNGETNNPIIIGGLRDQSDERDKSAKDLGHHLHFNFNGISFDINKDGELTATYGGATKVDGTTDVSDSTFGSTIKFLKNGNISVGDKDGKNQLLIDHENSEVKIARDSKFELGDATDNMLLASTYRKAETQMHNNITTALGTIQGLLTTAGAAITAACEPLLIPVVGGVIASPILSPAGAALTSAATQVANLISDISTFEGKSSQYLSTKNFND